VVLLVELLQALQGGGSCSDGGGNRCKSRLVRMRMLVSAVQVTSITGDTITIEVVYTRAAVVVATVAAVIVVVVVVGVARVALVVVVTDDVVVVVQGEIDGIVVVLALALQAQNGGDGKGLAHVEGGMRRCRLDELRVRRRSGCRRRQLFPVVAVAVVAAAVAAATAVVVVVAGGGCRWVWVVAILVVGVQLLMMMMLLLLLLQLMMLLLVLHLV